MNTNYVKEYNVSYFTSLYANVFFAPIMNLMKVACYISFCIFL